MRNQPIVSIIIPCYNQADYLSEAIESVLAQSYTNWECIIVNDGSTDNTKEEAIRLINKSPNIKYLEKNNGGLSSARNYGIIHSKGKYILPLDADDKIGKDYLDLAVQKLNENSNIKVVYCRAELFGEEMGEWILPTFNYKDLLLFNTIFCSALFRKDDFNRVGGYDENLIYGGEDWEFWMRVLGDGGEVYKLDSIQFYYRKKATSMHTELMRDKEKDKYTEDLIYSKHSKKYEKLYGSPLYIYRKAYKLEKDTMIIQSSRIYKIIKTIWAIRKKLRF